ncbi:MAG: diheme cytochrome c [Burkholderiales bacterium]
MKSTTMQATATALVLISTLVLEPASAAPGGGATDEQRWKAECSSCHVAYPPKLLSAQTWRRLMGGLDKHFGTDASIEPASEAAIGAYLEQNAGRKRGLEATTLRITDTPWFRREHDELAPAVWTKPAVKSASNCGACHTAADSGDFRERNIRIPR